ncbi:MAG: glycosyltransferase family 2 protein [Caldilineaceae bacterium]|nr:glycosyltransferase family 2 protein [Caldilineaceae bacterium]
MRVDLSIIIVSWNVWDLLRGCLASIEQISRPTATDDETLRDFGPANAAHTLEVLVVDSASHDATVDGVRLRFPWVRLIASDENLGFTRGNNLGYAHSRGETIFFLNPDTEIVPPPASSSQSLPPDSLTILYAALHVDPQLGILGPQLRYGDGSLQSSRRRFPTPLTGFFESTWLGRLWPRNPWAQRMHMADWPPTLAHEVDWVMGSAMICRRAALEGQPPPGLAHGGAGFEQGQPGPFDEGFFMYSEELDLCRRVKAAGWRIAYTPAALVVHYEGRSSEQVAAARHIYFNTSKVRYYRKWFGPAWAEALRRYLRFEFRAQLALEWVKGRLGHKQALRAARVAAYRQVIEALGAAPEP